MLKVSEAIEILIHYPDGEIQRISQYVGRDMKEAQNLMPYINVEDTTIEGIHFRLIEVVEDCNLSTNIVISK